MVLYHVAKRAGFLVVCSATFDADRLGRRDLHVVYIAAIPERFKDSIAEPERQDILNRLLAEVVIDAIDVFFRENFVSLLVQFVRACQIVPKRLLDNNAAPALSAIHGVFSELLNHNLVIAGLSRKIIQNVVAGLVLLLRLGEFLLDGLIAPGVFQIARDIVKRLFERLPD